MPTISVIIPCHNGQDYILDALNSVAAQTFGDFECVVIDDCSSDGSRDLIADFAKNDDRFRYILRSENGGASRARNDGIEAALGAWITFLDADDLYVSSRLETLLNIARENDAAVVADNQIVVDYLSDKAGREAFGFMRAQTVEITQEFYFKNSANMWSLLNPGYMKPMFSSTFLKGGGLRFDPSLKTGEDFMLFSEAVALRPRFIGTSYAGYVYRRRGESLSGAGGRHMDRQLAIPDTLIARHGDALSERSKAGLLRKKTQSARLLVLSKVLAQVRAKRFDQAIREALLMPSFALVLPPLMLRKFGFVGRRLPAGTFSR